jgi:MFS family permease
MNTTKLIGLLAGLTMSLTGLLLLLGNYLLGEGVIKFWPVVTTIFGLGLTFSGFICVLHKEEKIASLSELPYLKGKHKWEVWAATWTLETLEKLGVVPESPINSYQEYGAFFIPGIPTLTAGLLLLYTNVTGQWGLWSEVWTVVVLATGVGFAFAGIFMRVPGLSMPAFIIGVNALLLAYCANTGLWSAWIVMWPIEFLAIGLGLLTLSVTTNDPGVKIGASVLFTIAGAGFFISTFFSPLVNISILSYSAPAMLLITGFFLLVTFFVKIEEPIHKSLIA